MKIVNSFSSFCILLLLSQCEIDASSVKHFLISIERQRFCNKVYALQSTLYTIFFMQKERETVFVFQCEDSIILSFLARRARLIFVIAYIHNSKVSALSPRRLMRELMCCVSLEIGKAFAHSHSRLSYCERTSESILNFRCETNKNDILCCRDRE